MIERLTEQRLIPVARVDDADEALHLAEAILKGGLDVLEITLRTDGAIDAVAAVVKTFPEMAVGAGTIIRPEQVDRVKDTGACFGVAPGCSARFVERAKERDLFFIPGVQTASEIENALSLGCSLLKFFPAEPAGGAPLLKALAAPYAHTGISFVPLGGINTLNIKKYLIIPSVAAIGGSWLADRAAMKSGRWNAISSATSEALALASE